MNIQKWKNKLNLAKDAYIQAESQRITIGVLMEQSKRKSILNQPKDGQ